MATKSICIHVTTKSEAESKRVRYLLNRDVIKEAQGVTFFLDEDQQHIDELVKELMAKVSPDRVKIYRLQEEQYELETIRKEISADIEGTRESVEKFENYLISKRKGIVLDSRMPGRTLYTVYTNRGNVELLSKISELDSSHYRVVMKLHGCTRAVTIIYQEFKRELELFK